MNLIRPVIVVVFTACVLFLGVVLIWSYIAESGIVGMPFDLLGTARTIASRPWSGRIGLVLLAAGGGIAALKLRELRKEQCIAFDNPGGEVAISLDAVEDFIKRTGGEFHGVRSIVPRIHAGPEGIGIVIRMDIWAGTNIPRLSEEMQSSIKNKVQDALGINVSYVSVNVGKIVGGGEEAEEEK